MIHETIYLRTQAKRCRGMAKYALSEEGEAILRFVARDFDEAADGLENMNGLRQLSTHRGHKGLAPAITSDQSPLRPVPISQLWARLEDQVERRFGRVTEPNHAAFSTSVSRRSPA
jgi:hypothetical protein